MLGILIPEHSPPPACPRSQVTAPLPQARSRPPAPRSTASIRPRHGRPTRRQSPAAPAPSHPAARREPTRRSARRFRSLSNSRSPSLRQQHALHFSGRLPVELIARADFAARAIQHQGEIHAIAYRSFGLNRPCHHCGCTRRARAFIEGGRKAVPAARQFSLGKPRPEQCERL